MNNKQILVCPDSPNETECLLALLRAPNFGLVSLQRLLAVFPLPEIFTASYQQLLQNGVNSEVAAYIQKPAWEAVEKDLAWAQQKGHRILTWLDPNYPCLLKEVPGAPLVLYVRGDSKILDNPQLAIVGSRNPTPMGMQLAHEFAKHLSLCGLTITSGLALGIDASSHQGALAGDGLTIAVMGSGLDQIYPVRHHDLAEKILVKGGAVISEFPPGTPPKPENFPRRNRIISGLSVGVLVVEAALRSGSLITARYALEQGREIFAIPGSIYNPLARGCHSLLKQGAKLVETAADILDELGSLLQVTKTQRKLEQLLPLDLSLLDMNQAKLVECVGFETTSIDSLIERSGFAADVVSSELMVLELHGYITAVPGGYVKSMDFKKVIA